jgi:hypothetical protein
MVGERMAEVPYLICSGILRFILGTYVGSKGCVISYLVHVKNWVVTIGGYSGVSYGTSFRIYEHAVSYIMGCTAFIIFGGENDSN